MVTPCFDQRIFHVDAIFFFLRRNTVTWFCQKNDDFLKFYLSWQSIFLNVQVIEKEHGTSLLRSSPPISSLKRISEAFGDCHPHIKLSVLNLFPLNTLRAATSTGYAASWLTRLSLPLLQAS